MNTVIGWLSALAVVASVDWAPVHLRQSERARSLISPCTQGCITITPLTDYRALQEFEDSRGGGKTWKIVFKGEHRLRMTPAMLPPASSFLVEVSDNY